MKKKKIKYSYSSLKKYEDYQYKGLIGSLMKYDHRALEDNLPGKKYSKVLEIGPGFHPHLEYIKHDYNEYHILEKENDKLKFHKKNLKNQNLILSKYKRNKIPYKNNFFDRIIMCHVLEHVTNPEKFLLSVMSKLKKGGICSIALPTDPSLLWRSGRLFSKVFFVKKKQKISIVEYDYINSVDHVNSIFSLYHIINYYFGKRKIEEYLPFKIKAFDLNLFYNVHIQK